MCLRIEVPSQRQIMSEPLLAKELCFAYVSRPTHAVPREHMASTVDKAKPLTKQALEAATAEDNVRDSRTAERPSVVEKWLFTLPAQPVQSPLSELTSFADVPPRADSPVESLGSAVSSSHPVLRPAPVQGVPVLRKPVPIRAQSIRAEVCWTSSSSNTKSERPPVKRAVTGPQFEDFLSRDKIFASHEQDNEGPRHHCARRASALAAQGLKIFGKQAAKQVTKVAERVDHVVTEITASRHGHT
jgi:hypothetical protein